MKIPMNQYYIKIFMVLLVIGIIPVVILTIAVNSMTLAQTETLYKIQNSSIENKRKQIEVSLRYVDSSMIQNGLSGVITKGIRTPRQAKDFQALNAVNNQLKMMNTTIFPLSDMILVSLQKDWVMSQECFTTIQASGYKELVDLFQQVAEPSFWHYDDEFLYEVVQVPIHSGVGNGMLISKIDKQTILKELTGEQEDEGIVILDEKGRCVVGKKETAAIVDYMRASTGKWEALREGEVQQTTFLKENYVCAVSLSDFNGWTYVSVISNSHIQKEVQSVFNIMKLMIVSVIFILLILIIGFSKVLYHPIGALYEMVDSSLRENEGEEGPKDESILSKVHYLVRRNTELKKELSHKQEAERENYLRKLYQNELLSVSVEALIRHKVIGEAIDGSYIHVLGITYNLSSVDREDLDTFVFGLKNIISELVGTENSFVPVSVDNVIYVTHYKQFMSAEGAMLQLHRTCEMVISAIAQYIGIQINIGVSRQIFSVVEIPLAVEECNSAMRKAMGRSGACVFYGLNDENRVVLSEIRIKQKRLFIIQAVLEGSEEQCRNSLDEYFEKLDGVEYYLFKLEVNKLLSDILDCCNEYSLQPDYTKIREITDFDITKDVNSVEGLKLHLWQYFLLPLNRKVKEPAQGQNVIGQIVEYLSSHIEQDISLDQCARYFNYNPNYLSRMFKKQFGKTYTEYIIDKKLERCKELLADTNLSVQDISMRLGYNSPQNFIRVFKKFTLMTPGQYRNQTRNKNE